MFDPVSVGGLGDKGPVNVVYRSSYSNPFGAHNLVDWGGSSALAEHDELGSETIKKPELPYDSTGDGIPNASAQDAVEPEQAADEFTLDFGTGFDSGAWDVYWNPGAGP